jgi:hypothetical protein
VSTARVDFTRGAAERIARVVRIVETGERDGAPLKFDRALDGAFAGGSGVRLGTFTGPWPKDEYKTVTLAGGTATYSVKNVTLPLDMNSQSPNTASRSVLFAKAAGEQHAIEIEQGGLCGSWKEYLVTLTVTNCNGSGAVAIVRDVNIGTTPEPAGNSGPGPITDIDMVTGGSGYAVLGREQPTVGVSAASTAVTFTLSYAEEAGECDIPYWRISGITAAGPTGAFTPQTLTVSPLNSATEEVAAVLSLDTAGASVVSGGKYYKESSALTPYTWTLSTTIVQLTPSAGSGAVLTPVVDTSPGSPTFGTITSVTIDDGGSDYVAWKWSGSIPFGNVDLAELPDFKAYETQVLGHEGACLKWFSVTTCATATASP